MDRTRIEEQGEGADEDFDEFEDEDEEGEYSDEDDDYAAQEYEEAEEPPLYHHHQFGYAAMTDHAALQNPTGSVDAEPSAASIALSATGQVRRSTAGRRSLRSSRAASRNNSKMARLGRWTSSTWNGTKSWFLGPLFIGVALGVGISLGRSTFLIAMQRTTSLLLGRAGSARFGIAA